MNLHEFNVLFITYPLKTSKLLKKKKDHRHAYNVKQTYNAHLTLCLYSANEVTSKLLYTRVISFLAAKASKSLHQVCIERKITWSPLIHKSAVKIVPLLIRVYTVGFVKYFDIAVICSILNQSGQLWIKEKKQYFTGLNAFFKALNFRFCQVSQSIDY